MAIRAHERLPLPLVFVPWLGTLVDMASWELPVLLDVPSLEMFGLVRSRNNESFGGLLTLDIKDEDMRYEEHYLEDHPCIHQGILQAQILHFMDIDPNLTLLPEGAVRGYETTHVESELQRVPNVAPSTSATGQISPRQPANEVIVYTSSWN